ncbi:hypothetical protein [Streptomyces lavendulocolor]|uniref:hypothetical protein n=1 Tax=Streptomyces lavendulocolor TaxID=67316 RepID=UPI0031DB315F
MSITSPIPILRGNRRTELRFDEEGLLLRRTDAELRIPLAAIARVHAEGRDVTVRLTAPEGSDPTTYRIEDVSAAASTVFADAVNDALPEHPDGTEPVDGSSLVTVRSLRPDAADEDGEPDEGWPLARWTARVSGVALVALSVAVGIAGEHLGRAIATLLLGSVGALFTFFACLAMGQVWSAWYLPRYGIIVEGRQVFLHGKATYAFTDGSGVTRPVNGSAPRSGIGQAAYHPRNPKRTVACRGWAGIAGDLALALVVIALAAGLDYGTLALVLPAFT